MRIILGILICITLLISCEQEDSDSSFLSQNEYDMIVKSSSRINIDGIDLELQSFVWRDFMPGTSGGRKGLTSLNQLISVDSTEIPKSIVLISQHVIADHAIWNASYSEESRDSPNYIVERISRNGPQWEPGLFVTIIAEVKSLKDDRTYFVRLDDQKIFRTD